MVDFQHSECRAVRPDAFSSPVLGEQANPAVNENDGAVYVVCEPADSSTMGDWDVDLRIWKGDEYGVAGSGYPRLLVSGPVSSDRTQPPMATSDVGAADHVVGWQDDRLNGPLAPLACVLDLTATDAAAVPYGPATAGFLLDQIPQAQHAPQVGLLGIIYPDDRWADASGFMSALCFCQLDGPTSAGFFTLCQAANAWDDNASPVSTPSRAIRIVMK